MALLPYQEDDDVCTVINDGANGRFSSRDSLMNAVMKQRQMLFDALEGSLDRGTIERIAESRSTLLDTAAQLHLHRRLKTWLVVHVAIASALVIMLVTHIVTALTLLP